MKKNEKKQRKNGTTPVKMAILRDGRKLTWLSTVTNIHYQRLQRIVNQGYEPGITEAARIAAALGKPITVLFPSSELREALLLKSSKEVVSKLRSFA